MELAQSVSNAKVLEQIEKMEEIQAAALKLN